AVFDLSGSESAEKNIFRGVEGTLGVSLDRLTLDGFDPAGLAEFIEAQKSLPKDIALQLHKALRGGASDYADVSGEFRLAEGKARIESLSLENASASLGLSGALDMAAQTYDVKAEMTLKPLPDLGTLTVTRSGGLEKAPDYQLETGPAVAWIERHLPPPPAPEPVTTDPPIMPGVMAPQVEAVPLDAPRQEGTVPEIEVERLP